LLGRRGECGEDGKEDCERCKERTNAGHESS
jgi:hypothetical protein